MTSHTRITTQPRDALAEMRTMLAVTVASAVALSVAALAACGPSTPSAGSCKTKMLPGDLVITEVFADFKPLTGSTGTDTGKEWFEVYNATAHPIDVTGLTVTSSRADGTKPNTHTMREATIASGQYFVLGNATQAVVPAYVDYGYGADLGDLYNTGGGKLALSCGDAEIDSAGYDSVTAGHSRELTSAQPPEYTLNDDLASWCQANDAEFDDGNFGTPGAPSDCQPIVSGQCNDHGTLRDAVTPAVGDLVITEVMPSPAKVSDTVGEWFEAKAIHDVDLNGIGLDRINDTAKPDVISSTDCLHVTAGSFLVFARSTDPAVNGGLPAAIAGTFKFSLVAGTPTAPGDVAIVAGTTIIDAVTWTRSTSGKSLQLDPARIDPVANDDETNFCDATAAYSPAGTPAPDLGTPGSANTACSTLPTAGMCIDNGEKLRPIVAPTAGQLVISEFLARPVDANGAEDTHREWFEVTNTGAAAFDLNDLTVGRIGAAGTTIQSGKCISVAAGSAAVLAHFSDPATNGMLSAVAATFSFGLVDSNGDIQISSGSTVLDFVKWKSVTAGVSNQLDPNHLNTTDNDDAAANYCPGIAPFGDMLDKGTPGAANKCQ